MARFYGFVGFEVDEVETEPGIYEPACIVEKPYFGKLVKHYRRWEATQNGTNDNLVLANRISIVCDNYMTDHWPAIKFVVWQNARWKVDSAEIQRPRIILTLGGLWNGDESRITRRTS